MNLMQFHKETKSLDVLDSHSSCTSNLSKDTPCNNEGGADMNENELNVKE